MRVGVTGVSSDLGRGLLPRLEADPLVDSIVAFDVARPAELTPKCSFVRVDLTRPGMEADLTRAFREQRLDVLFHLAFVNSRVHGAAFAHELEVIGSMHVLAAAQKPRRGEQRNNIERVFGHLVGPGKAGAREVA